MNTTSEQVREGNGGNLTAEANKVIPYRLTESGEKTDFWERPLSSIPEDNGDCALGGYDPVRE